MLKYFYRSPERARETDKEKRANQKIGKKKIS